MNVSISPLAEQDIEAIGDYIAQDNPVRAVSFVESLYQQCILIGENLWLYRERPELGRSIRSCTYGRYLILYGTTETAVRIERVLHGARDIDSLFSALPDSPQS